MDLVSDSEWLYRQDLTKRFLRGDCRFKDISPRSAFLRNPNPTFVILLVLVSPLCALCELCGEKKTLSDPMLVAQQSWPRPPRPNHKPQPLPPRASSFLDASRFFFTTENTEFTENCLLSSDLWANFCINLP